jgi:hypothetical protein
VKRGRTGRYEATAAGDEEVQAFVPAPLPPDPPLDLAPLQRALEQALLAVGRLDALSILLPDTHLFLYAYVRKEAVLSSQIEGTQSSLSDLMLFELGGGPRRSAGRRGRGLELRGGARARAPAAAQRVSAFDPREETSTCGADRARFGSARRMSRRTSRAGLDRHEREFNRLGMAS